MKQILIVFFLIALLSCSSIPSKKKVHAIMVNHKIGISEWNDANKIALSSAYDMYYKQDEFYYYFAFKSNNSKPISFYVDLYFSNQDKLENLHASHQLGYRDLTGVEWNNQWGDTKPPFKWGFHQGWVANTVSTNRTTFAQLAKGIAREDYGKEQLYKKSINDYDGYEFQFSKKAWDLKNTKMRIALRDLYDKDIPIYYYPENSGRINTENWLQLKW